ncbi:hypothetical protein QYF36_012660 [Acer negundo]|nr:hypothetical protein QYF36_012660 [Acer negundo]
MHLSVPIELATSFLWAQEYISEYFDAGVPSAVKSLVVKDGVCKWQTPEYGLLKVNTDVAVPKFGLALSVYSGSARY